MKIFLKLYIKRKIMPLFVCEFDDEQTADSEIDKLINKLNSPDKVIRFHDICFNSNEFKKFEIIKK